jgi:hypothetical protein
MYPAGNLWFYVLVYKLHIHTRFAMYIWKVTCALIHTANALIIMRISKICFRNDLRKVQLIGFILITNHNYHLFNVMMFNDQLIGFFALLTIYKLVADQPLSAALFVSMALSIKAGGLLLVPTVFGWLHYFYGTTKLLQGILVLVIF